MICFSVVEIMLICKIMPSLQVEAIQCTCEDPFNKVRILPCKFIFSGAYDMIFVSKCSNNCGSVVSAILLLDPSQHTEP